MSPVEADNLDDTSAKRRASCSQPSLETATRDMSGCLVRGHEVALAFITLGLLSELGEVDRIFTRLGHLRLGDE